MAIRNIVKDTDNYDTLHKKCRPVTEFNQKLWDLLDDMAETMYQAEGVGLAGPQVGMLRRVFVIDLRLDRRGILFAHGNVLLSNKVPKP